MGSIHPLIDRISPHAAHYILRRRYHRAPDRCLYKMVDNFGIKLKIINQMMHDDVRRKD